MAAAASAAFQRPLLLLLAVGSTLLLACCSSVSADTTGQQVAHAQGYTFGSNVEGYLKLSTDICDIKKAIGEGDKPDYVEARKIYLDGKNSKKSDGTVRTLRELATKPYAGEPFYDMYASYYKTPAFLDQPVSWAFAGDEPYKTVAQRNETITKGIESSLQYVYLIHELDEAAELIKDNKLTAAKGAPHNIDETWAIYTGELPACSLWGLANRRAKEFGTMQDCKISRANADVLAGHRRAYTAAEAGSAQAFAAARADIIRAMTIPKLQSVLKYAHEMDDASAANDAAKLEADQAEGAAYFRTIAPLVAQANNASAAAISRVFTVGGPAPRNAVAIVQPALEAAYKRLGVDADQVGAYGASQALGCGGTSGSGGRPAMGGMATAAAVALGAAAAVLL